MHRKNLTKPLPWSPGQFHEQASGMAVSWSGVQYSSGTCEFHCATLKQRELG